MQALGIKGNLSVVIYCTNIQNYIRIDDGAVQMYIDNVQWNSFVNSIVVGSISHVASQKMRLLLRQDIEKFGNCFLDWVEPTGSLKSLPRARLSYQSHTAHIYICTGHYMYMYNTIIQTDANDSPWPDAFLFTFILHFLFRVLGEHNYRLQLWSKWTVQYMHAASCIPSGL